MKKRRPRGYWTKERCKKEALKYKTRTEFQKNSSGYSIAAKSGWINDICKHMTSPYKPRGYWTKERCKKEALKYKTRTEFMKKNSSGYSIAAKSGWIDDICKHMTSPYKPSGYWNKERCKEEALKYKTRTEFMKKSPAAYSSSLKQKIIDDICKHMTSPRLTKGYWSKENALKEALKYKTKNEFKKHSNSAYRSSKSKIWFEEICKHMISPYKPSGYWTKERCKKEALKYKTKSEFMIGSSTAYSESNKNSWMDEISSHMEIIGNKEKRSIYAIKFDDKSVYIGLTGNFRTRHVQHVNKGIIFKKKNKNYKTTYTFLKTKYKYSEKQSQKLEEKVRVFYKNRGWKILNIAKTGALGGSILRWTKERCRKEALKYKTKSEFKVKSPGAYSSSLKQKIIDDICKHMTSPYKPSGYWTKERCKKEALKYRTRTEFQKNSSGYSIAVKSGWLDDICKHMTSPHKPSGYWTKERCKKEALKYKTRTEFQKKNSSVYSIAQRSGWINDICKHMTSPHKPRGYWTKERCKKEALKYKTRTEFQKKNSSAYSIAHRSGWINEICKHMSKRTIKWTKDLCLSEALKYKR